MNPQIAEPTHASQSNPTDLSVNGLFEADDEAGLNPLLEPSAPTSIGHNDCAIDIYDPWDVDRALAEIVSLPSIPGKVSAADHPTLGDRLEELGPEQRARAREFLKMIAQGPARRGILGNDSIIARVEALKETSPQFNSYIDEVLGQLAVSKLTATSLSLPPAVLLGPPGVGKHISRVGSRTPLERPQKP